MVKLCLLLAIFISTPLMAGQEKFQINERSISLNVPSGWEAVKDLFGMPLVILGPMENEARPAIMFLSLKLTPKEFDQDTFPTLFQDFKLKKEDWLKSHKGELLSFEPATAIELRKDLKGHFIGAKFKINEIEFIERSYFLSCKNNIFNVKYSLRQTHEKYLPVLQKLAGEFVCE